MYCYIAWGSTNIVVRQEFIVRDTQDCGFIQDFFLGGGNVDACNGCTHQGFVDLHEILDIYI